MDKDTQHLLLETVCILLEESIKEGDYYGILTSNLSRLQHAMMTVYDKE